MADFAQIDSDNIVQNVIVADQSFVDSDPRTFKEVTTRGGRGWTWDESKSDFIAPQPYLSWTLNSDNNWEAPIPMPAEEEGKSHSWNETDQQWDTKDALY